MLLLVQYTLTFASVLILVALGGCIAEHSGVINLGLEGIMVMGAMGGALMMRYMPAHDHDTLETEVNDAGVLGDTAAQCHKDQHGGESQRILHQKQHY